MARDTTDDRPIESKSQMVEWLAVGCKPKSEWRIGTEHEKFGFYLDGNKPVPYGGDRGIRTILEKMQAKLGWEPIIDDGNLIGLFEENGQGAISLEPGGQFELSGAPVENLHQTCQESNRHLDMVKVIGEELGIGFLGLGGSPLWTFEETPRMPKSRYEIMTNYMPKVGAQGHDMMYRTCTIQVNLDFDSERDMVRKLQTSLKLQGMASALFANSPFTEGKPNGFLSWRSDIWRDVDNQRGGYHAFMLEKDFNFESYVDWALDLPMYFVIRDGRYHDCTHVTFRQFMNGALKGEVSDPEPTIGDWSNHMTTVFPDVRLKRFLEMRGADGGQWRRICALPAFWVGLLYSSSSLDAAEDYISEWTPEMVFDLREAVPKEGLNAKIAGQDLHFHARKILEISRLGLVERAVLNCEGFDESIYLNPLHETIASGLTPAEHLLQKYHGEWNESLDPLFREYAF
ncbi:MAG: glutamate--cysteine ligase [Rhizobiaceae bacterium]|nr:glutamate--cysteine ligase [Rhizobiaceae bacterium]MBL4696518.1 glutamate--cysteine ligase [Rhizobiaceae bacterium]